MNKQLRTLIILLVILAALIGGYFVIKKVNQSNAEKESAAQTAGSTTLQSVSPNAITGLSYTVSGDVLSFTKQDGVWKYDTDSSMKVDESKLSTMLSDVSIVTAKQTLSGDSIKSEDFGFEEPTNVITVTTENGTNTFTYGMKNSITGEYYMILNQDVDHVYVMDTSVPTELVTPIEELDAAKTASADAISDEEENTEE